MNIQASENNGAWIQQHMVLMNTLTLIKSLKSAHIFTYLDSGLELCTVLKINVHISDYSYIINQ